MGFKWEPAAIAEVVWCSSRWHLAGRFSWTTK